MMSDLGDTPGFSPRTRGCSVSGIEFVATPTVFPAHAGMFLGMVLRLLLAGRFPRARGDVPPPLSHWLPMLRFSPRTRGCSGC